MVFCCSIMNLRLARSDSGRRARRARVVSTSLEIGFLGGLFRSLFSQAPPLDFIHLLRAMRMRPIFSGVRLLLYSSSALSTAFISELRGVRSWVSASHCWSDGIESGAPIPIPIPAMISSNTRRFRSRGVKPEGWTLVYVFAEVQV